MVETEAIYRSLPKAFKDEVRNSLEWKWRERFYLGHNYLDEIINSNLGATDEEVRNYYDENLEKFQRVLKNNDGSESVVQEPFHEVRRNVVSSLFLQNFPPDSAFLAQISADSALDSSVIKSRWLYSVRTDIRGFFLDRVYYEKYGEKLSDSLDNLIGPDKIITPEDMAIIRHWWERRAQREAQDKELAEWLLTWKLFSERARREGYDRRDDIQQTLEWAWKVECSRAFVSNHLVPDFKSNLEIDTTLALYSFYDRSGNTTAPDSAQLAREITQMINTKISVKVDSAVHEIRNQYRIEFLQADWKDNLDENPQQILARADSLSQTGNMDKAARVYQELISNFLFTEEGKRALVERAKINIENRKFLDAVRNYRKYQIINSAGDCNSFFMIGFIYDENLRNPALAEVNYQWVLKNTPDCDLAHDTEFMLLHLDEQMSSVTIEELQAQTARQNRKFDFEELDL
ncbi:hypothetical protein CHISP_2124 [Chitinispirillum alkaliphilum]|nr:hypothetical protein CHISP_2124 [Chitinispirillum alkaliphilum]